MPNRFSRTEMLLGRENMERLFAAKVAVFGIGGVGGSCAEALARTGIGRLDLFDSDRVCVTNINRQAAATTKTVGQYKTDAMRERILDINPNAEVKTYQLFYTPETAGGVDLSAYDYIADAVDTMAAKIELVCRANALGVPVISCMGAANKLDASAFEVADIYKTSVCPMARIMRTELRKRGIPSLKVVYSKEPPLKPLGNADPTDGETPSGRRQIPASNAFTPPAAGLIMAGEIVRDLIKNDS